MPDAGSTSSKRSPESRGRSAVPARPPSPSWNVSSDAASSRSLPLSPAFSALTPRTGAASDRTRTKHVVTPPARLAVLLLSLAGASQAFAGRPVFHALTLEQLAERADAIVVVTPLTPLARRNGCLTVFRFRLVEILKAGDRVRLPAAGMELRVSDRGLAANLDCEARRAKPGGVSFAAERYERPGGPLDLAKASIVFLVSPGDGGKPKAEPRFVADRAWEALEARSQIEAALGQGSPAGSPFGHAVARSDCAPWDGPALSVLLSPSTATDGGPSGRPRLSISLWASPRTLAGRTVKRNGSQEHLPPGGPWTPAPQVSGERHPDIAGQRKPVLAAPLAVHHGFRCSPVDVFEGQPCHLSGP